MKKNSILALVVSMIMLQVASPVGIAQSQRTPTNAPVPTPLLPPTPPAAGVNLTVSPTFLNLVAEPGETVTAEIKIKNNNNFSEYLRLDTAKFEAAEGGERPLISEFEEGDEYQNWISYSEEQFVIESNQTKTVTVTISPPEDASLGYYYTIIVNRTGVEEDVDLGASVSGAISILALLEVASGDARRELQLVDFKTDKFFYEYLPTTFEITVKNTGNIHLAPSGDVFIDSMRSKDVGALRANEGRGNILPNSERTYTATWDDGFAVRVPKEENGQIVKDDNGNIVYTTKYNFTKADKFRIGKYTANLLMIYDNGERDIPLQATVSFWIIPYKMILSILAIIVAPAILVFFIMKWRYGKKR